MWYDVTIAPLDRLCFSSSLSAFWSWCIELRDFMSGHLDWAPQAFTSSTPFLLSPVLLPLSVCVHTQAPALHLFCCVMNKCLLSLTSLPHVCGIPAKHRACGGGGHCISLFYSWQAAVCSAEIKKMKNWGSLLPLALPPSTSAQPYSSSVLLRLSLVLSCHSGLVLVCGAACCAVCGLAV